MAAASEGGVRACHSADKAALEKELAKAFTTSGLEDPHVLRFCIDKIGIDTSCGRKAAHPRPNHPGATWRSGRLHPRPTTIGFDLAVLQSTYGDAAVPENTERMDRLFRHVRSARSQTAVGMFVVLVEDAFHFPLQPRGVGCARSGR